MHSAKKQKNSAMKIFFMSGCNLLSNQRLKKFLHLSQALSGLLYSTKIYINKLILAFKANSSADFPKLHIFRILVHYCLQQIFSKRGLIQKHAPHFLSCLHDILSPIYHPRKFLRKIERRRNMFVLFFESSLSQVHCT